ncbi:hypothetical protein KP509_1Z189400 [Ceratopteris richardii]|nr:hypothetical protein KP509_1Z189400 [Ceratopteris richardii]
MRGHLGPLPQQRVRRWLLLFQEFDFEIVQRSSRQHVFADHLSRIKHPTEATKGVEDDFLDSQIYRVNLAPIWYGDLTLLLAKGQFRVGSTPLERRRLLLKSKNFIMVKDTLYRVGLDGMYRKCLQSHETETVLQLAFGT